MLPLLLLTVVLKASIGYKIAVFVPEVARSQVIFGTRVSHALADAGHNVTMILIQYCSLERMHPIPSHPNVQHWLVNAEASDVHKFYPQLKQHHAKQMFAGNSVWSKITSGSLPLLMKLFINGCGVLVNDTRFIAELKDRHFDLAITHVYDFCPLGFIHIANIPYIIMSSGTLVEPLSIASGVPSPPSYVPPTMSFFSDQMTFTERLQSFLMWIFSTFFYRSMNANQETELFRKRFGDNFPHLIDLVSKSPLIFVNSNEMYDFARPTLHKIVYIGGIGLNFTIKKQTPLPEEFVRILAKTDNVVVMSFGSVANVTLMPASWKKAFMDAFASRPDIQFILRYDANDLDNLRPPNVHFFPWLTQNELLRHPKVKMFITHGGYNGLQETANAGKPAIVIPLFGDQHRNARITERRGFGYVILHSGVTSENIRHAINEILTHPRYTEAAKLMGDMLRKQPIKPEERLIKWSEFVAEFKTLDNLIPYGNQLNFIVYYCIDVILFLAFMIVFVLSIIFCISRCLLNFCCRKLKTLLSEKEKVN